VFSGRSDDTSVGVSSDKGASPTLGNAFSIKRWAYIMDVRRIRCNLSWDHLEAMSSFKIGLFELTSAVIWIPTACLELGVGAQG